MLYQQSAKGLDHTRYAADGAKYSHTHVHLAGAHACKGLASCR